MHDQSVYYNFRDYHICSHLITLLHIIIKVGITDFFCELTIFPAVGTPSLLRFLLTTDRLVKTSVVYANSSKNIPN